MPVYSFSTRDKRPDEDETVKEVKAYCEKHKLNFSRIIIEALTAWRETHGQRTLPNNRKS